MSQYDNHHYVYYDLVDEWLKPTEFPFLIDWRMDDDGNFFTFTRQVIEQERAVGVQRLSQASHRSFVSCNMFDSLSLSVTYYIANSCIPYIGTAGKKLTKLVEQRHLPTDAAFVAIPGYHRVHFPFVMMDVSSKGEVYIVNTKTWFRQLLVKMVKDHTDDLIAQFFFSYEPKHMHDAQVGERDAGKPSMLYIPSQPVAIDNVKSICLNYIEQNKSKDGSEVSIT